MLNRLFKKENAFSWEFGVHIGPRIPKVQYSTRNFKKTVTGLKNYEKIYTAYVTNLFIQIGKVV